MAGVPEVEVPVGGNGANDPNANLHAGNEQLHGGVAQGGHPQGGQPQDGQPQGGQPQGGQPHVGQPQGGQPQGGQPQGGQLPGGQPQGGQQPGGHQQGGGPMGAAGAGPQVGPLGAGGGHLGPANGGGQGAGGLGGPGVVPQGHGNQGQMPIQGQHMMGPGGVRPAPPQFGWYPWQNFPAYGNMMGPGMGQFPAMNMYQNPGQAGMPYNYIPQPAVQQPAVPQPPNIIPTASVGKVIGGDSLALSDHVDSAEMPKAPDFIKCGESVLMAQRSDISMLVNAFDTKKDDAKTMLKVIAADILPFRNFVQDAARLLYNVPPSNPESDLKLKQVLKRLYKADENVAAMQKYVHAAFLERYSLNNVVTFAMEKNHQQHTNEDIKILNRIRNVKRVVSCGGEALSDEEEPVFLR